MPRITVAFLRLCHLQGVQKRCLSLVLQSVGTPVPEKTAHVHPLHDPGPHGLVILKYRAEHGIRDAWRCCGCRTGSVLLWETGRPVTGLAKPADGSWQDAQDCPTGLERFASKKISFPKFSIGSSSFSPALAGTASAPVRQRTANDRIIHQVCRSIDHLHSPFDVSGKRLTDHLLD